MTAQQVIHLFARTSFGTSFELAQKSYALSRETLVENLFSDSKNFTPLIFSENEMPNLRELKDLKDKKKLQEKVKEYQRDLNLSWLKRLISQKEALRERMVFYWHNHFACAVNNPIQLLELNNICRKLAFAPFKELLMAVSKSPAMLNYLNNQQNRKKHPNENFARELMELFTIGRGNYTENDIKESARTFTGWAFNRETSEFEFRQNQHDSDEKTFMGENGNFSGEDIIDILLKRKETAVFLCRKFYKHLVNDIPDDKIVNELAEFYYANNYDTEKLLRKIFLADWFYDKKNIGVLIKSPIELLVNLTKTFEVSYAKPETLFMIQRLTGQVLFSPPNVAGWPGGKNWIDSSTIMFRLKLTAILINDGIIEIDTKFENADDINLKTMERVEDAQKKTAKRTGAKADWIQIEKTFNKNITTANLITYFIPAGISNEKIKLIEEDKNLKDIILKIVSLPEYQMC
jgi:uncharacterized protein (DUF1800 family)